MCKRLYPRKTQFCFFLKQSQNKMPKQNNKSKKNFKQFPRQDITQKRTVTSKRQETNEWRPILETGVQRK